MIKLGKTPPEIYIDSTIEFDTILSLVRVTILKRIKIRIKELMINLSQKKSVGIANEYVTQLNKLS